MHQLSQARYLRLGIATRRHVVPHSSFFKDNSYITDGVSAISEEDSRQNDGSDGTVLPKRPYRQSGKNCVPILTKKLPPPLQLPNDLQKRRLPFLAKLAAQEILALKDERKTGVSRRLNSRRVGKTKKEIRMTDENARLEMRVMDVDRLEPDVVIELVLSQLVRHVPAERCIGLTSRIARLRDESNRETVFFFYQDIEKIVGSQVAPEVIALMPRFQHIIPIPLMIDYVRRFAEFSREFIVQGIEKSKPKTFDFVRFKGQARIAPLHIRRPHALISYVRLMTNSTAKQLLLYALEPTPVHAKMLVALTRPLGSGILEERVVLSEKLLESKDRVKLLPSSAPQPDCKSEVVRSFMSTVETQGAFSGDNFDHKRSDMFDRYADESNSETTDQAPMKEIETTNSMITSFPGSLRIGEGVLVPAKCSTHITNAKGPLLGMNKCLPSSTSITSDCQGGDNKEGAVSLLKCNSLKISKVRVRLEKDDVPVLHQHDMVTDNDDEWKAPPARRISPVSERALGMQQVKVSSMPFFGSSDKSLINNLVDQTGKASSMKIDSKLTGIIIKETIKATINQAQKYRGFRRHHLHDPHRQAATIGVKAQGLFANSLKENALTRLRDDYWSPRWWRSNGARQFFRYKGRSYTLSPSDGWREVPASPRMQRRHRRREYSEEEEQRKWRKTLLWRRAALAVKLKKERHNGNKQQHVQYTERRYMTPT